MFSHVTPMQMLTVSGLFEGRKDPKGRCDVRETSAAEHQKSEPNGPNATPKQILSVHILEQ